MSTNLGAPALVGGQATPETTVNDAVGRLDAAVTETLDVDLTNDVTVSDTNYKSHLRFNVTTAGTGKKLTLRAVKHLVIVSNNDATDTISVVLGTTSIDLVAGASGFFYTDGTANGLLSLSSLLKPFDLNAFIPGLPGDGVTVLRFKAVRAFSLPASLTGSYATAGVASTGTVSFTIKKNGSSIGSISFATSSTGTFTFASAVSFAVGDLLTIHSPTPQDATLQDVALNLLGTRT